LLQNRDNLPPLPGVGAHNPVYSLRRVPTPTWATPSPSPP